MEATVFDPMNPYVLKPHLLCAAAELPLKPDEVQRLGVADVVDELTADGLLRRRKAGWYLSAGLEPHAEIDIRVESAGRSSSSTRPRRSCWGTVDTVRALSTVHPGAVHIHQGRSFVVDELDLDDGLALAHPRSRTGRPHRGDHRHRGGRHGTGGRPGALHVALVEVTVTSQVVGYLRKLHSGGSSTRLSSTCRRRRCRPGQCSTR